LGTAQKVLRGETGAAKAFAAGSPKVMDRIMLGRLSNWLGKTGDSLSKTGAIGKGAVSTTELAAEVVALHYYADLEQWGMIQAHYLSGGKVGISRTEAEAMMETDLFKRWTHEFAVVAGLRKWRKIKETIIDKGYGYQDAEGNYRDAEGTLVPTEGPRKSKGDKPPVGGSSRAENETAKERPAKRKIGKRKPSNAEVARTKLAEDAAIREKLLSVPITQWPRITKSVKKVQPARDLLGIKEGEVLTQELIDAKSAELLRIVGEKDSSPAEKGPQIIKAVVAINVARETLLKEVAKPKKNPAQEQLQKAFDKMIRTTLDLPKEGPKGLEGLKVKALEVGNAKKLLGIKKDQPLTKELVEDKTELMLAAFDPAKNPDKAEAANLITTAVNVARETLLKEVAKPKRKPSKAEVAKDEKVRFGKGLLGIKEGEVLTPELIKDILGIKEGEVLTPELIEAKIAEKIEMLSGSTELIRYLAEKASITEKEQLDKMISAVNAAKEALLKEVAKPKKKKIAE
ncbi:MAG: hypothetical protein WCX95_01940, partial [Candidatus Gracilibacteria bacterium]